MSGGFGLGWTHTSLYVLMPDALLVFTAISYDADLGQKSSEKITNF